MHHGGTVFLLILAALYASFMDDPSSVGEILTQVTILQAAIVMEVSSAIVHAAEIRRRA